MTARRITMQFNVTTLTQQSPAVKRVMEYLGAQESAILRRERTSGVIRSGAMIEEAGLGSVLSFLDNDVFHSASEAEKQDLILRTMALRLNMAVVPAGSAAGQAAAAVKPVHQPAPAEEARSAAATSPEAPEAVQVDSSDEPEVQAPAAEPAKPANPAASAVAQRFKKLGGA